MNKEYMYISFYIFYSICKYLHSLVPILCIIFLSSYLPTYLSNEYITHPPNLLYVCIYVSGASQVALVVKNLPVNARDAGDTGLIPGLGRFPGEGNSNPTPAFLSGKFHGQRSLSNCSSWGHKELDMTE